MEDVKVEVKTVEVKSEASVIDFSPSQVENIIRNYVNRKKKLPDNAVFTFTMGNGCRISWKKEDKKPKSETLTLIAGDKKPTNPENTPANGTLAGSQV